MPLFRSEAITDRIMTEMTEKIKDFIWESIIHYKEIDFQQIEETIV